MHIKYLSFSNFILACLMTVSFCLESHSARASENDMEVFFTIITKAYCDKCMDGFEIKTSGGYSKWKHEVGLGDTALPTTGDLGKQLKAIRENDCTALSKGMKDLNGFSCESLVEKFKVIQVGPDSKYISSETTWNNFIDALKNGDRKEALACFETAARADYKSDFDSFTNNDMRNMAEDMNKIRLGKKIGNYQEGIVHNGGKSGIVRFVNMYGEWKISQL